MSNPLYIIITYNYFLKLIRQTPKLPQYWYGKIIQRFVFLLRYGHQEPDSVVAQQQIKNFLLGNVHFKKSVQFIKIWFIEYWTYYDIANRKHRHKYLLIFLTDFEIRCFDFYDNLKSFQNLFSLTQHMLFKLIHNLYRLKCNRYLRNITKDWLYDAIDLWWLRFKSLHIYSYMIFCHWL